jgi:hypothetical protein
MSFILRGECVIENIGYLFCSNSAHASFVGVSCLQLIDLSPVLVVRQPVADICLYHGSSFL